MVKACQDMSVNLRKELVDALIALLVFEVFKILETCWLFCTYWAFVNHIYPLWMELLHGDILD